MKTHGAAPTLLPKVVGGILPLSAKKDADTANTKHVYVMDPHVAGKAETGNTKHVYVMEPDVRPSGSQLRQVGVAHEGVAATIVIPAPVPGAVEVDLAREVYLYR